MSKFIAALKPYRKAIAGGVGGALTALGMALADGAVTQQEWVGVALGALAGSGIVYIAPRNEPQS